MDARRPSTTATLRLDDRVQIHGIRPAKLNGRVGKIAGLPRTGNSKRFDVLLDGDTIPTRGIPAACLTKI